MLETGKRIGKDVYFDLNIQSGHSAILPNQLTPTLGINQSFLGVTLRANKGDRVHIKVKNSLDKTTTLHWHGMKLPAKADGGPHQPIQPSGTWLSEFDIVQNAATLWYHSHQIHQTGPYSLLLAHMHWDWQRLFLLWLVLVRQQSMGY